MAQAAVDAAAAVLAGDEVRHRCGAAAVPRSARGIRTSWHGHGFKASQHQVRVLRTPPERSTGYAQDLVKNNYPPLWLRYNRGCDLALGVLVADGPERWRGPGGTACCPPRRPASAYPRPRRPRPNHCTRRSKACSLSRAKRWALGYTVSPHCEPHCQLWQWGPHCEPPLPTFTVSGWQWGPSV